ncbi:MAG: hypothetical protein QXM46_01815 [Candidatus Hadarchaeales archaeon]
MRFGRKRELSVLAEHGRWISHLLNDFRVLEQRLEYLEKRVELLEDQLRLPARGERDG